MNNIVRIRIRIMILSVIAIIAVTAAIVLLCRGNKTDKAAAVQKGIDYIRQGEAQDVPAIENEIYYSRKDVQLLEAQKNMEEDPDYVWTALSQINTVFMGDSRTLAYSTYGFVDESRCMGENEATIRAIPDRYGELQVINPKMIVIAYGLNDIGNPWMTPEEWSEELMQYVDEIHSFLPDCKVYIQSDILPRMSLDERWPGIYDLSREWNSTELEIFRENGYDVIDIGDLVEENAYLFIDDGVHLEAEFYPKLARKILETYLEETYQ